MNIKCEYAFNVTAQAQWHWMATFEKINALCGNIQTCFAIKDISTLHQLLRQWIGQVSVCVFECACGCIMGYAGAITWDMWYLGVSWLCHIICLYSYRTLHGCFVTFTGCQDVTISVSDKTWVTVDRSSPQSIVLESSINTGSLITRPPGCPFNSICFLFQFTVWNLLRSHIGVVVCPIQAH